MLAIPLGWYHTSPNPFKSVKVSYHVGASCSCVTLHGDVPVYFSNVLEQFAIAEDVDSALVIE
jgi:hypothetical protein